MTEQEQEAAAAAPETTAAVEPQSAETTTTAPAEPNKPADTAETGEQADPEADSGDDSADGERPKKSGGFQKRIDKLTRENYEKDLRLQQNQRELEELRKKTQAADAVPTEEPKLENYDSVEKWQADHGKWARAEGKREAQKEIEANQAQQKRLEAIADLNAREDKARQKYPDYDQVTDSIAPIVMNNPILKDYVLESPKSQEVAYHLAKNPEKLAELTRMSPLSMMREIGRLEDRLSAPPPPKPVTKAPEPIKPVGARDTVSTSLAELAASDDATAYIERANKKARKT